MHKLFGLAIDGRAMIPNSTNQLRQAWLTEKFGFGLHDFVRSGNAFYHGSLDFHMAQLVNNPQIPPGVIASGYMLEVLGCLVLNDRTTTTIPIIALDFVTDHLITSEYAWSVGVLTYLYRQLGISSRQGMANLGGCTALLQVCLDPHTYVVCYY